MSLDYQSDLIDKNQKQLITIKVKHTKASMASLKDLLKGNRFIYNMVSGVKAQILEAKCHKEVLSYHQRADKLGLAYSETLITQRLNEKLRYYNIQPKAKGNLHIFAAVYNANWERHSLFPQLKKFGKVKSTKRGST